MMGCPPSILYQPEGPAARHARIRDEAFFADRPRARWRVRPLLEGECPMVDGMREQAPDGRAYAIVIHHARAGDQRAEVGLGVYPLFIWPTSRAETRRLLEEEGERWSRWFRKHRTTPPPMKGRAAIRGLTP